MTNPVENEQLCSTASECVRRGVGRLETFPGLLRKIIETQAWKSRRLRTGEVVEMRNLHELITTKPLRGWGESTEKIEAVIKSDPEVLAMYREAIKQQGNNQHTSNRNNMTDAETRRGTGKAYTLERLKRDSPELFKAVCNGEMTANQAAIKAGFRRKTVTIRVDSVEAMLKTLNKHCTPAMLAELSEAIKRS